MGDDMLRRKVIRDEIIIIKCLRGNMKFGKRERIFIKYDMMKDKDTVCDKINTMIGRGAEIGTC